MIEFTCPTREETDLLKQHYKKTSGTVSQKAHAVLLSATGKTAFDIAQVLFHSEKTVRQWIKLWHRKRMASLFSGNHLNQNASKLTAEQKEEITKALSSPPSEYGIPKTFWDVSTLRDYMVGHFGVIYESPQSYHFLFKISNFSFKYPAKFDTHRNDREVKKQMEKVRETITPFIKDHSWVVLCGDESRIVWEAIVRRCWLPRGEKTIIKVERENIAQNLIGFLDLKSGKEHLFPIPWQNQKEIIKVLKLLLNKYPGKKICLLWDNATFHKGKLIREALKTTITQFFLVSFPPYAPDCNPQEHVWNWGKNQIANIQFGSLTQTVKNFRRLVTGRSYPYQI